MLGCHSKVNLSLKMETITCCGSLLLACVMINGIIKKYENKEKTPDLCENPCGKKPLVEEKTRSMALDLSIHKSRTADLRVEHKPKTKFGSQNNNLYLDTNSHHN